ncbi:MAG: hypothetical protein ACRCWB_11825 [Enterovibrio sp.]
MIFKSFETQENLLKAQSIVADHMRWYKATLDETYEDAGWTNEELNTLECYQEYLREPATVAAIVAEFSAEEVIRWGDKFYYYVSINSKKAGFPDFCSIVDSITIKSVAVKKRYEEIIAAEVVEVIEAVEEPEFIVVETKSERFTKAHELSRANVAVIGDYFVALSHYLKMIKIAKPEAVEAVQVAEVSEVKEPATCESMIGKSVSFSFGNKTPKITITGCNDWSNSNFSRVYFDFDVTGNANPLHKLYEIVAGGSRDHVVEVEGRKFGYSYGFCDSNSKRAAVDEAVRELLSNLL